MLAKNHILVTGGAGFMGSAFIRYLFEKTSFQGKVSNLDLLTYAGNLLNLKTVEKEKRYRFFQGDIVDTALLEDIYDKDPIDCIVHFAAETHVDRSIKAPNPFIHTNVLGTYHLLSFVLSHPHIHFHHVSTDEVYGSLGQKGMFFENSPYLPNSPYAASKAASDHFVRAYQKTYGLSVTISHASNNYGPGQYREKFIPTVILNCLQKEPIPLYGKGNNIRDWLFVEDHSAAIWKILEKGSPGEVYNIGGNCELNNRALIGKIIMLLAEILKEDSEQFFHLITFIKDRLGHDFRYSLNTRKIEEKLGFYPSVDLACGLKKTIHYFLKGC